MRCVRCNRLINTAAATVGIYSYGPKCAKAAGLALIEAAAKHPPAVQIERDQQTRDWVREAALC